MNKRWILTQPDLNNAQRIAQEFKISPLLAQVLLNRRLQSHEEILSFLQPSLAQLPDPSLMKDMDQATRRLVQAIAAGEIITIYGDYDVDGTTATVLLLNFLQAVGAKVDYYIPHRMKEGYSLNCEALDQLAAKGTKVLITVDKGISAVAEARHARDLGMDLIITDHHEVPPELPVASAILNPKQKDDTFPGKELAGVGVAYYLIIGLRRALRDAGRLPDREPNLRQALDLVAVGTIADLAPLKGLNRVLVREGLKVLSRTQRTGLQALKNVAGISEEVRADQVAFQIGPRINAAGRLQDASLGVQLLLTEDEGEARRLAEQLDRANVSRREMEDQICEEATHIIDHQGYREKYRSLVLFHEKWHSGVIGIVASRLVERFHLPTILLTADEKGLKGSARSIKNFNLVAGLRECASLLTKFGGHAYAAGLSLKEENLEKFREAFDGVVRSQLQEKDFQPFLQMDVESSLGEIDPEFLDQLSRLEPFGLGNPPPLFLLRRAQVRDSRIVGEKHLRMRVGQGQRVLGAIGFRLGAKQPEAQSQVDLAFIPEWNEWNGNKNIQLRLLDLRPARD
ncbi:MAG: single-stranded-DNA-specific exonuclease RecJ [bacterium]|nr:single-stranded-DNA-specific exonuclease RecJ [bacterium]